jgi:uncharacterized protein
MAVVIFKAIERCNSNCIYCDVIKKHQDTVMGLDLIGLFFRKVNEFLQENPSEKLLLTWHGGEVCLLGADFLKCAADLQDQYCPSTKNRIEHLVQSNLTCITQEIIDVFKYLGVTQIGSSYDPHPHIRGFGAKRNTDAYNRKFFDGTALLDENKMTWGVIYVVHRLSLASPLDVFYHLTNINLRTSPSFNPIYVYSDDGPKDLAITPEEYARFLGAIFPVWWKNRDRYPGIRPLSTFVSNIIEGDPGTVCEFSGNCANEWFYVGPEGKVSHCGRAGDFSLLDYGTIHERSISEIIHDVKRNAMTARRTELLKQECGSCRFWGLCHGGCPLDSLQNFGDFLHPSPDCAAIRTFITDYFEPITGHKAQLPPPSGTYERR